jgi:NitT/TauT family transport system ATP-binding protein
VTRAELSDSRAVSATARTKIVLRGVRKQFSVHGRPVEALDSIDLQVADGEFLCIIGPSGCGKTTLLRILASLDNASAGSVSINRNSPAARPTASMVFQEQSIFPWMSVRDNIAFGLKAQGIGRRARYRMVEPYIHKVGLQGFEHALPHQLSGGMKQRVSLARALANDPDILLMDEPFASLDEQTKLILQAELLRVWEADRKTVVYVTHSIDEAILLGDRVIVMSARPGRIKHIRDISAILPRPRDVESVRASVEYGTLFAGLWSQLRDEAVEASMHAVSLT